MRDGMLSEVEKLERAVCALEQAASARLLARAKILARKIMIVCERCNGSFRATPDGVRCWKCGQLIPVMWPDGRKPTYEELHYMLALAYHDAPDAARRG